MRRLVGLALVVAAAAAVLLTSGVVTVKVNPPRTENASASPFWQEKGGEAPLPAAMAIWVELARAARPAVVNVSTTQRQARAPADDFFRRFFEGPGRGPQGGGQRQSLGSGFIVSGDGYIVTNFHVVREAAAIVIRLSDQSEFKARLVGSDPKTDIALLKVDATGLTMLPFGDSDRLQVGEPVMAIGNPFGLDQTVTTGIVSAKERFIGSGPYDDFIQTDASVNPGNSGGPLVDTRGALVGINTAIFSQSGGSVGIGFAIPVNLAKDVLVQLRDKGTVTRGYLGVSVTPVTPEARQATGLERPRGALVAEVAPRSPAAAAGLKPGDIITAFQGTEIQSPHDLTRRVGGTPPGVTVALRIARPEGRREVTAKLGELRDVSNPDR
jgi:serine protease Do